MTLTRTRTTSTKWTDCAVRSPDRRARTARRRGGAGSARARSVSAPAVAHAPRAPPRWRRAPRPPGRRRARRPGPCPAGRRRPCRRASRVRAHEVDRVETARQIGRDADDDAGLAVLGDADDRDDARADLLLALVGEALQIAHLDARDGARQELDAADSRIPDRPPGPVPPPMASLPGPRRVRARACGAPRSGPRTRRRPRRATSEAGELVQRAVSLARCARALAGHRLDAADAGGDGALARRADEADVAGAAHMGAAAELDREGRVAPSRAVRPCPSRRRGPRRRISRRRGRARRTRSASSTPIRRVDDRRRSAARCALTMASTAASSSSPIGFGCRSRSAGARARPASPSGRHGRRAPGAAPHAADGWRNGWRGWPTRRVVIDSSSSASPTLSVPSRPCTMWAKRSPSFFCVS